MNWADGPFMAVLRVPRDSGGALVCALDLGTYSINSHIIARAFRASGSSMLANSSHTMHCTGLQHLMVFDACHQLADHYADLSFPGWSLRGNGGTSVCALYRGSVLRSFVHGLELAGQWRYFGMRTVPGLSTSKRSGLHTTSASGGRVFQ